MTASTTSLPDDGPVERAAGRGAPLASGRIALAGVALAGCAALGWVGSPAGLAGAVAAAGLLPLLLRRPGAPGTHALIDNPPRVSGGRVGAEVMVAQVVPVWGKQIDITRQAAATGLAQLLDSFSQRAGALGSLGDNLDHFRPGVDGGAIDGAPGSQAPALAALLAPSQRAFDQRDAVGAKLIRCANAIEELRQLGRQARDIGKPTRLVAFNASIEASRGTGGGMASSAQAIVAETRTLAARMAGVGDQIGSLAGRPDATLTGQRLRAEIDDISSDELRLELDLRAREALTSLLRSMGGGRHGAGAVKASSRALQAQLEETFVHLQFGDRLNQMLDIVGNDMQNFACWVAANPCATQTDAAEWLAQLETRCTMEEQRAQHHGNVHINRGSEVEFS